MKINTAVRTALWMVLDRSREYDPSTLCVARNGMVSALKSADKTFAGNDSRRYFVGYAEDMVCQDGKIREGY